MTEELEVDWKERTQEAAKRLLAKESSSQAATADRHGLSQPTLSRYANGKAKPEIDAIVQIARGLGETIDVMLRVPPPPGAAATSLGDARDAIINALRRLDDVTLRGEFAAKRCEAIAEKLEAALRQLSGSSIDKVPRALGRIRPPGDVGK